MIELKSNIILFTEEAVINCLCSNPELVLPVVAVTSDYELTVLTW